MKRRNWILGLALAAIHYSRTKDRAAAAAVSENGMVRIDDEEVEING